MLKASVADADDQEMFETDADLDRACRVLVEHLPVALFVLDHEGNVLYANGRLTDLVGYTLDDMRGRNALDFVDPADADFVASLLLEGTEFSGRLMGPSRVRYVDRAGTTHWTQVWAYEAPPELGIAGYIITLTPESMRDVLASAVGLVAVDGDLDQSLGAVALSARGEPIDGVGAVLVPRTADGRRFRVVGHWPLSAASLQGPDTPWAQALADGAPRDIDVEPGETLDATGLARPVRDDLRANDIPGLWVRPILGGDDQVEAVYVVFRRHPGRATRNQDEHVAEALRIAHLAFVQQRRHQELERAARRDSLTGVANRTAFDERVAIERRAVDVLFVDLDHFKAVNDTYGHDVGDAVLAEVGHRLGTAVRRTDVVYRTGGDEFVVLCDPTGADPAERIRLAERIIAALTAPFSTGGADVTIGATVGIAAGHRRPLDEAIRAADAALYEAKGAGRSCWAHAA